ncbi:Cobalamin adenosyltransferase [Gammaproteobacteria bacterium]
MVHRFTKIRLHTGDQGITGLGDRSRLPKDAPRIQALGEVDELSCVLGVLRSLDSPDVSAHIVDIQRDLFELGVELAFPGRICLTEETSSRLEEILGSYSTKLPRLRAFILPGGNHAAASCHFARSICRRAERSVVTLSRVEAVNPLALRYLNRLSDVLFVLARWLNHLAGQPEIPCRLE